MRRIMRRSMRMRMRARGCMRAMRAQEESGTARAREVSPQAPQASPRQRQRAPPKRASELRRVRRVRGRTRA